MISIIQECTNFLPIFSPDSDNIGKHRKFKVEEKDYFDSDNNGFSGLEDRINNIESF